MIKNDPKIGNTICLEMLPYSRAKQKRTKKKKKKTAKITETRR